MDNLTPEQRTKNMKAIKSKDTKAEVMLRKALWKKGYRYFKNYKKLPGKPDIVFSKKKTVIFVDGEFWHGFDWENRKQDIKSNREYWIPKIERNMQRDKEIQGKLEDAGWIVLRFWSKNVLKNLDECVKKVEKMLNKKL
ncbi:MULTISPECIES: very short patch repair endonuclease [Psychrilyobacter]|uniref:Very short patch repair endonuclease n=1 Tax=Psychrilyobacter piezotolerans TaxID=2293438 RepID=A0ABX9KIY1_9FUSO|nr:MULTISPECIES: very short patch repair endonuclease [Psychrilyobacter]MCS5420295.1 very short patch repair endonuclease [Psychrilyobacter sp. S5]NDI77321.1 very short patch repair endonuclease [Psychrilyobacter piezotolerans]RDE63371.1 very short patch repair endonuclease [Psychrilyobacter sp. S5]REI41913.1 DNA mismatch endonuclease Vsr [Psychrilyobacter piezotolerans]